ncbi:MAG: hypothetical protein Q4C83_01170 [Candidatus Saccharibacteria bacterium]|nr:hypothetical protein [Candidatus Saccharibacteria bacterium]
MSAEEKPLTGIKKRQQISDARKQVFGMVALASAAVVVCIMVGMNVFGRIMYQNKVNAELSNTLKTMDKNVENIDKVIDNVDALRTNTDLNLPNLKADDSTVFQVIIDALPTENDNVALSSSLQNKILATSGIFIEQLTVDNVTSATSSSASSEEEDAATSSTPEMPVAQAITFRVSFTGSIDAVNQTLQDIEKTIRPITINKITIDGSDEKLTVVVDATTYYSENVDFQLGEKEIPYEEE